MLAPDSRHRQIVEALLRGERQPVIVARLRVRVQAVRFHARRLRAAQLRSSMSLRRIADELAISRQTVDRLLRVGYLPALENWTRGRGRPRSLVTGRYPHPARADVPPDVSDARDELTRDFGRLTTERELEIMTRLRAYARRFHPCCLDED